MHYMNTYLLVPLFIILKQLSVKCVHLPIHPFVYLSYFCLGCPAPTPVIVSVKDKLGQGMAADLIFIRDSRRTGAARGGTRSDNGNRLG